MTVLVGKLFAADVVRFAFRSECLGLRQLTSFPEEEAFGRTEDASLVLDSA